MIIYKYVLTIENIVILWLGYLSCNRFSHLSYLNFIKEKYHLLNNLSWTSYDVRNMN